MRECVSSNHPDVSADLPLPMGELRHCPLVDPANVCVFATPVRPCRLMGCHVIHLGEWNRCRKVEQPSSVDKPLGYVIVTVPPGRSVEGGTASSRVGLEHGQRW